MTVCRNMQKVGGSMKLKATKGAGSYRDFGTTTFGATQVGAACNSSAASRLREPTLMWLLHHELQAPGAFLRSGTSDNFLRGSMKRGSSRQLLNTLSMEAKQSLMART